MAAPLPCHVIIRQRAILLRYQYLVVRNAALTLWRRHRRDSIFLLLSGGFLLLHELDVVRGELFGAAAWLQPHGVMLGSVASLLMAAAGWLGGQAAFANARRLAQAPLFAVLPLRQECRPAMLRGACILPGAAGGAAALVVAQTLFCWMRYPGFLLVPLIIWLLFMMAFCAAVWRGNAARYPVQRNVAQRRSVTISGFPYRLAARLDRGRPAWCGLWAMSRLSARGLRAHLAVAMAVCSIAGVIAVAQAWPFVGVAGGVAAGHYLFLATTTMHPLVAPPLRCQPLAFPPAFAALMRLPCFLSALPFAVAAVIAGAGAGAAPALLASGAAVLLALNLLAGFAAAALPRSCGAAWLLHAGALWLTLYERIEYGDGMFLCLAAYGAFMARQGVRAFRYHG